MSTALQVHTGEPTAVAQVEPQRAMRLLRPVAEPAAIIAAQEATRELVTKALKSGRDYGKVPGVDKPSLLKPGAERVTLAFGCYARFSIVEQEIDHDREVKWIKRKKVWNNKHRGDRTFTMAEESGVSLGLYRYVVRCDIVSRETETVVGGCLGSCSTLESKYIDRPRDCENTALKMAEKRALVGATLVTFGLSEQFTQDVEDGAEYEPSEAEQSAASRTQPATASVSAETTRPSSAAAPTLTRDSVFPFGKKFNGTKVRDLPEEFLVWAIEPGRKFGEHGAAWVDVLKAEVYHRTQEQADKPGVVHDADPYGDEPSLALGDAARQPTTAITD